jgi:hypothetical protein
MQYFLGYSALIDHPPFDPSLFVEIRKRLGDDLLGEMNLRILEIAKVDEGNKGAENPRADDGGDHDSAEGCTHKGELLMDATVAPQDIAYPTDLNLLNRAREITEKIIDALHVRGDKKPRTYRKVARKAYLKVAQNRNPSKKAIRKGVGQQLRYVGRNLKHIDVLLLTMETQDLSIPRLFGIRPYECLVIGDNYSLFSSMKSIISLKSFFRFLDSILKKTTLTIYGTITNNRLNPLLLLRIEEVFRINIIRAKEIKTIRNIEVNL